MGIVRVLVVEDSPTVREFVVGLLSSDPEIQIVGVACDGEEAVEAVRKKSPDVVAMDFHMPKMDGLEATRRIMETKPVPIVIVSGSSGYKEGALPFSALAAGALAVVKVPASLGTPEHEQTKSKMIGTIKLMSEVKVVRRWSSLRKGGSRELSQDTIRKLKSGRGVSKAGVVAIGASTGGPAAIQFILSSLPADFPLPVLIVQHMAPGFADDFVNWIAAMSALPVKVCSENERALGGRVYVAPDNRHLSVGRRDHIMLSDEPEKNGIRPSVSFMFRSVANVYGNDAVGIILSGMGKDGAEELKLMRDRGAITIAQDRESSVVFGMPGEAVKLDAAELVLPLAEIPAALLSALQI